MIKNNDKNQCVIGFYVDESYNKLSLFYFNNDIVVYLFLNVYLCMFIVASQIQSTSSLY